jgi:rubrerythrin
MYEGIERKDVKDVLAKIIEEEKTHIEEFKKLL